METNLIKQYRKLPYVSFLGGFRLPAHYMWCDGKCHVVWNCSNECHRRHKLEVSPTPVEGVVCSGCGASYQVNSKKEGICISEIKL